MKFLSFWIFGEHSRAAAKILHNGMYVRMLPSLSQAKFEQNREERGNYSKNIFLLAAAAGAFITASPGLSNK